MCAIPFGTSWLARVEVFQPRPPAATCELPTDNPIAREPVQAHASESIRAARRAPTEWLILYANRRASGLNRIGNYIVIVVRS